MKFFIKTSFFICIFLSINLYLSAQGERFVNEHLLDLSLSGANNNFTTAFSWSNLYGVGKNRKFKIGYGARFNAAFMNEKEFVTAPAKLTSGVTNPSALFADNILSNYDTLFIKKGQVNSLNLNIHLQYSITSRLDVGFNIDAIGFSFGKAQTGTFQSSMYPNSNGQKQITPQNAKPTSFNLLLISDNDLGSLNSEIYARYWFHEKWAIKAGGTFIFSEYTTDKKLALDNDRFRYKSLQFMVGVSYQLKKRTKGCLPL